jgi:hypothetical protein
LALREALTKAEAQLTEVTRQLEALIAKWRREAEQHKIHGDCYRKGQGWGLRDCADELAALSPSTEGAKSSKF